MTTAAGRPRRSPGSRRVTAGALAMLLAVAVTGAPFASRAHAGPIPTGQALVSLLHDKVARAAPSARAPEVARVASHRPLTGERTVLPVLARVRNRAGVTWVDVRLPGRPNSGRGWITTGGTTPNWTPWRLSVDLAARQLTVYYAGRVIRRFSAVVGKPSTPTPTGRFFIEEDLALSPEAAGAPFALATSARSDVLSEFDGGPGQIAIHGVGGLPGALGTAASHGCIRLASADITWLAFRIGPGVPLTIYA